MDAVVPSSQMFLPLARTLAVLLGLLPLAALAADPTPEPAPNAAPADMIRTPPAPATPRINGPRVYGERPGHPFFYHLPVTGERPITITATGLPAGLTLDPATGNITGTAADPGQYPVEFTAANARGKDTAALKIVIGDTIALTPPMGYNSWNHFAGRVSTDNMRAAADAMVSSGLIDHGWTYVNIDDCWQGQRDAEGNIQGNAKFPDLKALGDYIHGKGLKFGLYSSPGPKTCAGFVASYQHEDQDAATYAKWGVDYVKYDLCSYGGILQDRVRQRTAALLPPDQQPVYAVLNQEKADLQHVAKRAAEQDARLKEVNTQMGKLIATLDGAKLKAINVEEHQLPYRVFADSLRKVPRDIVYSFCQYGDADSWEWAASLGANSWRTTGDISANWKRMSEIGFSQDRLAKYAGPGHWNDPDMLEIGNQGLTPDECYTHMTLWCMLSAPLLIGCDMSQMDPLTISMFSNDEVLAVNQDALGKQGYRLKKDGTSEVWVKPLADGSLAVALFNRSETVINVSASWIELQAAYPKIAERTRPPIRMSVRDLWRQKNLGFPPTVVSMPVAPHSAELLQVGELTAFHADP